MEKQIKPNSKEALSQLQTEVEQLIAPLGYELVAIEKSTAGGNRVTLFIDFTSNATDEGAKKVSLDDCVAVNRAVDELFENTPLLEGHYTLEVSSPGVERPLRKQSDYERFSGRKARINLFRPLERDEVGNPDYWEKNKRQKNFVGRLMGLSTEAVKMDVDGQAVLIPLALISKAHLEFEEKQE